MEVRQPHITIPSQLPNELFLNEIISKLVTICFVICAFQKLEGVTLRCSVCTIWQFCFEVATLQHYLAMSKVSKNWANFVLKLQHYLAMSKV